MNLSMRSRKMIGHVAKGFRMNQVAEMSSTFIKKIENQLKLFNLVRTNSSFPMMAWVEFEPEARLPSLKTSSLIFSLDCSCWLLSQISFVFYQGMCYTSRINLATGLISRLVNCRPQPVYDKIPHQFSGRIYWLPEVMPPKWYSLRSLNLRRTLRHCLTIDTRLEFGTS